jgi:hypothetical protein
VQPAVGARQRHTPELADRPDGVEVTEQEDLRRAAAKLRQQMVATLGAGQARDAPADRLEPRRQLGAAPVHRRLVRGRRLEAHERFRRLDEPAALGAAEIAEAYNRGHGSHSDKDTARLSLCPLYILCPLCRRSRCGAAARRARGRFLALARVSRRSPPRRRRSRRPPHRVGLSPGQPEAAPTEATLGVNIFPGAQFIASMTPAAGSATTSSDPRRHSSSLVTFYRTILKQKGELVYEVPATHAFDVGRYRRKRWRFPPGVTIKDYLSDVSQGYPNPKPGGQPARFPTLIQIVPVVER